MLLHIAFHHGASHLLKIICSRLLASTGCDSLDQVPIPLYHLPSYTTSSRYSLETRWTFSHTKSRDLARFRFLHRSRTPTFENLHSGRSQILQGNNYIATFEVFSPKAAQGYWDEGPTRFLLRHSSFDANRLSHQGLTFKFLPRLISSVLRPFS